MLMSVVELLHLLHEVKISTIFAWLREVFNVLQRARTSNGLVSMVLLLLTLHEVSMVKRKKERNIPYLSTPTS